MCKVALILKNIISFFALAYDHTKDFPLKSLNYLFMKDNLGGYFSYNNVD